MELDSQLFLQLRKRLDDAAEFLHIDDKKRMLAKLDAQSSEEGFWQDVVKAQEISKQAGVIVLRNTRVRVACLMMRILLLSFLAKTKRLQAKQASLRVRFKNRSSSLN